MTWLSKSNTVGHVRLWVGCLSELQGMANAIFRSTDCFTHIGDASTNQCNLAEILGGNEPPLDQDISEDPIRAEAGYIVAEIGLAMIILHEVGHHAHQHSVFYPRGFRLAEHQRRHTKPATANTKVKQACELEADDFGLVYILRKASQQQPPFSTQLVAEGLQDQLFALAILAYSLVIAFLHDQDHGLEAYDDWDHPHPAVRLYASQLGFAPHLEGRPEARQAFQEGLTESFRILQHGALQQKTMHLLLNERDRLQERTQSLVDALAQAREQQSI